MPNNNKILVIAGGGTGGHVLAGIAIADAWCLQDKAKNCALFIGARGGMEEKLVPQAGYSLELLSLGSLNRVSVLKKIKTLLQLPFSFFRSAHFLIRLKPQFVLGVGGYSSGPVVMIAKVLRKLGWISSRVGILEQNSIPGLTNRILSPFVDVIFTAFPKTEVHFPQKKVLHTGNPIRAMLKALPPACCDPFTLFIFGGSQGAIGINTLVLSSFAFLGPLLRELGPRLQWIHQTGVRDFERVAEAYKKAGIQARVSPFVEDMKGAYAQASLLICRAGSSTLAEISAVGRAAVLIPLPTAADNHQEYNARILSDAGAACLVLQQNSKGQQFAELIQDWVSHPERIHEMEKKVRQFYLPNAAETIVKELIRKT